MVRIGDNEVVVFQGPVFLEHTEDGPITTCRYFVGVTIADIEYVHQLSFAWHEQNRAENLAARVRAAGRIDPNYWDNLEPAMPLEDKFDLYAEREWEVNHGLRAPEEMYHGIP